MTMDSIASRLSLSIVLLLGAAAAHAGAAARCPEVDVGIPSNADPTSVASAAAALKDAPLIAYAIRDDHGYSLKQALASGMSPDVCVLDGGLVAYAAALGAVDDLRILIDHGVDPDGLRDPDGGTALLRAISTRHFDSVALLLDRGADPRVTTDSGNTALLTATSLVFDPGSAGTACQLALAKRLLAAGAAVDARLTRRGTTSLMQSALRGDADMVRLLLDHGADAAARNAKGISVLDFARKSGNAEVVAMVGAALAGKR